MKTLKEFTVEGLRSEIKKQYKSVANLKKALKNSAVKEYGTYMSSVSICGCEIFYTSNCNHFCEYGIRIPFEKQVIVRGLDASSITLAGKKRGCMNAHISI